MPKFKIIFDGEEEDEIFDTYEQADDYALDMQSCCREDAEILNLSNPGDYDFDEDTYEPPDYDIIEVDD